MPSPGWYADPEDPTGLRWFDGDNWTEHQQRQPAATAAADTWSQQTGAAIPAGSNDYGSYRYGSYDEGETAPQQQIDAPYPGGANQVYPPQQTGAEQAWAPTAATAALPGNGGPRSGRPGRTPSSNRHLIVLAIVVVLVAGLVSGWLLLRGGGTTYTFDGATIKHPATALSEAEQNLTAIVARRHGVENSTTHCYYALPAKPATGAKKTDIDPALRCGPVLFLDGDPSQTYLSFALQSAPTSGGVTVTPSGQPQSNQPAAAPAGMALKRPDGKKPPSGDGGLQVPSPPPADANVLTATTVTQPPSTTAVDAVVGSLDGGITIHDIGKVTRYGTGDNARSAPAGQQMYAFQVSAGPGNDETVTNLTSSTTLSVGGAAGRALPATTSGQAIVVAVPTGTTSLDLVLADSGVTQTFSLLTASPGARNIAVLARTHRDETTTQKANVTFHYSTPVQFADNTTGQAQTATVSLTGASLVYRDDLNKVTVGATNQAFLIPEIVFTGSHDGGPFGLDTSLLTFTPTGGAPIKARNISADPKKIRNVFQVSAGVTTGVLTISGTATETFSGGGGSYTVSVVAPLSLPITFQAG
jgi:hypothetical protein